MHDFAKDNKKFFPWIQFIMQNISHEVASERFWADQIDRMFEKECAPYLHSHFADLVDVQLLPRADRSGRVPGDDICRNRVVLGGGFGGPKQRTITKVIQHEDSIRSSNNLSNTDNVTQSTSSSNDYS